MHCSKSRENFVRFHYRIFSTVVSDKNNTSKERRKASYNADEALYIIFADTDPDSGSFKTSFRRPLNQSMFSCKTTVYALPHLHLCKHKLSINSHN